MTNVFPSVALSKSLELSMQLVDLNVAKFATMVKAQTTAMSSFVDLATTRVKAAADIKDYDDLMGFTQEQTQMVQSNVEKLITDCKSVTEDTMAYGKEVHEILNQSMN